MGRGPSGDRQGPGRTCPASSWAGLGWGCWRGVVPPCAAGLNPAHPGWQATYTPPTPCPRWLALCLLQWPSLALAPHRQCWRGLRRGERGSPGPPAEPGGSLRSRMAPASPLPLAPSFQSPLMSTHGPCQAPEPPCQPPEYSASTCGHCQPCHPCHCQTPEHHGSPEAAVTSLAPSSPQSLL